MDDRNFDQYPPDKYDKHVEAITKDAKETGSNKLHPEKLTVLDLLQEQKVYPLCQEL